MNAVPNMHAAFASALMNSTQLPTGLRGDVDAARRFGVHRNNVMVALVDALASAFPVTRALVGEEFFVEMTRDFVRFDPPRSPVMTAYGAGFADFIASHGPASEIAYLADVARLERLRSEAFHAADAEAISVERWNALLADPARLASTRVRLQPACRWLESVHPVLSLWLAHQQDAAQRDTALVALNLDTGEDVLAHRPQWDVQQLALPAGGVAWLDALRSGETIGKALHRACATSQDASPELLFALLVQQDLVISIDPTQDDQHA